MNILFPTDMSEASHRSFGAALDLAQHLQCGITLLHVYDQPVLVDSVSETGIDAMSETLLSNMEKAQRERLHQFRQELEARYQPKVHMEEVLRSGLPAHETAREAAESGSAYIVVSVRHMGQMERLIFGSMVNGLLHKSHVPVLTIPEEMPIRKFHRICYATDFTLDDNPIIERLLQFAGMYNASVHCVHIHDSNIDTENAILQDFQSTYKHEIASGLLSFHLIESLNVMDGLVQFIENHNIDMVAMLKQRRYWLDFFSGSHTKRMAFHGRTPLLVFHE